MYQKMSNVATPVAGASLLPATGIMANSGVNSLYIGALAVAGLAVVASSLYLNVKKHG